MQDNERTLLEGALRQSALILVHGLVSSSADVAATLEQLRGPVVRVDLRETNADPLGAVRRALQGARTLLLEVPATLPEGLSRAALAMAGRPREGDEAISLGDGVRVVAIAAGVAPPETLGAFPMRISGMKVIEQTRERAAAAERELRAAQERARESSRRYGIR